MTKAREERGFTMVELLVTMAITMVVFGATLSALDVFQTNNRIDLLRNETQAEDMAQDICLRIWKGLPGYNGRASLSTTI